MNIQVESIQTQVYGIYRAAASQLGAGAQATGRLIVSVAGEAREYALKGVDFASTQLKALAEKVGVVAKAVARLAATVAGGAYDYALKGMTFIVTQTRSGADKLGAAVKISAAKISVIAKMAAAKIGEWTTAVGQLVVSVAGVAREYAVRGFAIACKQIKSLVEAIETAVKATGRFAAKAASGLYDYTSRVLNFVAKQVKAGADKAGTVAKSGAEKVSAVARAIGAKIGAWAEAMGKLAVKIGTHVREYTLKAVKIASAQLQNPRYAYAAVIASNIVFLEIMFKAFGGVDNLLNKTSIRDGNLGPKAQTFKEIMLLCGGIGTLVALNMAFATVLKPNISQQAYIVTSVASCVGHFGSRVALAHVFDKQPANLVGPDAVV